MHQKDTNIDWDEMWGHIQIIEMLAKELMKNSPRKAAAILIEVKRMKDMIKLVADV